MRKKETVKISKKIISIPANYFFFCIILSIICYFLFPGLNLVKFPYNLIIGIPLILLVGKKGTSPFFPIAAYYNFCPGKIFYFFSIPHMIIMNMGNNNKYNILEIY